MEGVKHSTFYSPMIRSQTCSEPVSLSCDFQLLCNFGETEGQRDWSWLFPKLRNWAITQIG